MDDIAPHWDLESVCPGGPGGETFIERHRRSADELAALQTRVEQLGPLAGDPDGWATLVLDLEQARIRLHELSTFAGCSASADTRSGDARRAEAMVDELDQAIDGVRVWLSAAVTEAPDEIFTPWVARDALADARPALLHTRAGARFQLPREQQSIVVSMERESLTGWGRLYDLVAGGLTWPLTVRGETRTVGVAELLSRLSDADPDVRRAAHHAQHAAWDSVKDLCAHTLTQITGSRQTRQDRLGVDPVSVSLHRNRLQRATLDAMWTVADTLRPTLVRYLERKAKLLGKSQLDWWDLDAPLQAGESDALTWDGTTHSIEQAFATFHPDLSQFARRAFDGQWIDAAPGPDRRAGGFCANLPVMRQSRIFMTFTGSHDNGMTLAHELGHAWHNHVISEQSGFRQRLTSALAETASTFAEAIYRDQVLEAATDRQTRVLMLDQELQAAVAFLMNIPFRFKFEERLYELRRKGSFNPDELSAEMVRFQRETYADALASYSPLFWCWKLHYYIPSFGFYNWPYTFGYLFSAAVYARAKAEGPSFMPALQDLLRRTGWQDTEPLVAETMNADTTEPAFWASAAAPIAEKVQTFLELTD
ncbi:MAG: M3 family metallopeptidase [Myxococcota bacterium]